MMEASAAVRLILLEVCVTVAALLFIISLAATASYRRAQLRAGRACSTSALAEYLWTLIPWVILATGAFPAARLIVMTP